MNSRLLYFDFETTGLNPFHEKIIDYCFIEENEDESMLENLVNPQCKLPKKIIEITNITDDMLYDKQPIIEHMEILRNFFDTNNNETLYLIAHNCDGFDKHFLNELHKKYFIRNNMKFLDSLLIAKKYIPDQKGYSLLSLCKRFGIIPGSHRARSDTEALKKLYHRMLRIVETKTNYTYKQLLENPNIIYDLMY